MARRLGDLTIREMVENCKSGGCRGCSFGEILCEQAFADITADQLMIPIREKETPEMKEKREANTARILVDELSAGNCMGIKGSTAYKVRKFAIEKGLI